MTTTQRISVTNSTRRYGVARLAIVLTLGILAVSCGTDGAALNSQSARPRGYSYDHDSRINEVHDAKGYSYDHDSRING